MGSQGSVKRLEGERLKTLATIDGAFSNSAESPQTVCWEGFAALELNVESGDQQCQNGSPVRFRIRATKLPK